MEKFAFLNLLKELNALSTGGGAENSRPRADDAADTAQKVKPRNVEESKNSYNVLLSVMERHEAAAYRIRNKHK